jgi:hypothetical protein
MKFIRRPDLDPQTRIHIVMLAWLHQGLYGKMTEIANSYRASITASATSGHSASPDTVTY